MAETRQVIIDRNGSKVTLTVECVDEAAALMLYDATARMAREGTFLLRIVITPASQ